MVMNSPARPVETKKILSERLRGPQSAQPTPRVTKHPGKVSLEARVKELEARVADVEYQYKQIAEFGSNTSLIRLLGVAARQVAGAGG